MNNSKRIEAIKKDNKRLLQNIYQEIESYEMALNRWVRKLHENIDEMERLTK